MANPNAAYGLIPVRHMSGNSHRANKYTITSGLAENIFTGDLVILTADGVITPHTATETNNIGVFAGVAYTRIRRKLCLFTILAIRNSSNWHRCLCL